MAELKKHLEKAFWTECEVIAIAGGAIVATKFLDERRFFGPEFAAHPEWFDGNRDGAPAKIKWFGVIKAGGAALASTYIDNPWIKMALFGVALTGTFEVIRQMTWNAETQKYRFRHIGDANSDTAALDAQLKAMADNYRAQGTSGPSYLDQQQYVNGPDYINGGAEDFGNRYQTAVAGVYDEDHDESMSGPEDFGNRYTTAVAAWSYKQQDETAAV